MADQNEMEKIVTSMMEHLCDHLCRFPWETERKEDLEDICAECQMNRYVCDILNTYNRVNPILLEEQKMTNEDKVPVIQVLDDMYDPDGGLVSLAARDYYYMNYAAAEEQKYMEREDKNQTIFAFLFVLALPICAVLVAIFN